MNPLKFDAGLIAIGGFCAMALIGVVAAAQVGHGAGMPMAMNQRPASAATGAPRMAMAHTHHAAARPMRAMKMRMAKPHVAAAPSGVMQMAPSTPMSGAQTVAMRMPSDRGGGGGGGKHASAMKGMGRSDHGTHGAGGMGGMGGSGSSDGGMGDMGASGDSHEGSSTLASANGTSITWEPPQPGQPGRPSEGPALVVRGQNLPYEYGAHGGEEMHAMMNAPCSPTPEQQAAADRLYQQTNAVLRQYDNNPAKALADGFTDVVGPADRFVHMINWPRVFDNGTLNPGQIESFMYALTDRGLTAIGGMYIMPAEFKDGKIVPKEPKHGPQIGGCLTRWHKHQGWVAGMTTAGSNWNETPEMLHVWTYPDLYPWGDYDGRQLARLWKPWADVPSVCRVSEPYGTDICFP